MWKLYVKSYCHFKGLFMWQWHCISCHKLQLWCFWYHKWFLLLWQNLKWQKISIYKWEICMSFDMEMLWSFHGGFHVAIASHFLLLIRYVVVFYFVRVFFYNGKAWNAKKMPIYKHKNCMSFDMEIVDAIWTKINIARRSSNSKSFPISNIFTFANGFFLPFQVLLWWKKWPQVLEQYITIDGK